MNALRLAALTRQQLIGTLTGLLNGGYFRIYTGTLPATPDTAGTDTLLLEAALGALSAPVGDTLVITLDNTLVQATGTAGRYLAVTATAGPVLDGPVYLQSDPNAPLGALLLPMLDLTVNLWISGTLTLPILMTAA